MFEFSSLIDGFVHLIDGFVYLIDGWARIAPKSWSVTTVRLYSSFNFIT